MSRRLRTLEGGRGADSLRNLVAIATIMIILLVFFLFAFSLGLIQPFFDNMMGITPPTSYQSSATNPISAQTLLFNYQNYAAAGVAGKVVYVQGNITGFRNPGLNQYGSCIALNLTNPYGCSNFSGAGEWVIWQFQDSSQVFDLAFGTNFVANCVVSGMVGNDLYLESCHYVSA